MEYTTGSSIQMKRQQAIFNNLEEKIRQQFRHFFLLKPVTFDEDGVKTVESVHAAIDEVFWNDRCLFKTIDMLLQSVGLYSK